MAHTRRALLVGAAAAGATLALPGPAGAEDEPRPMPERTFGATGRKVSLFGLGCHPLGTLPDDDAAVAVIVRALDLGCTYLDTAPSYSRGTSERRVGRALSKRPDRRPFLATKTLARSPDDATRDLEQSLERLGVPRVDLIQVHAVRDADDLDAVLDPKRGPLPALARAKEAGLVRHVGVTGHADPHVMQRAIERFGFESLLIPLNCVDPHYTVGPADAPETLSFVETTLPVAAEKGIALVAMKVFSSGRLATQGVDARQCLRFSYGLDVSTVIVGCRTVEEVELAARVAREDRPLEPDERAALLAATRPLRGRATEWYKRG